MESSAATHGPAPEVLLARYREVGRPRDLAALFDATTPELFRLALHLCPDAATAEDVLQETFLAVLQRARSWDPGRPAMPWLTGILRNEALMARRRAARRPDPVRVEAPDPPEDPILAAADAEERERLRTALQSLPEPLRGVALLRWRYGLEPAAIADVKGIPPGTVRSWLHRALRRLRVEMGALPALLLAFRPERGLGSVRSALLRRAAAKEAAAASAATGAGTAAALAGGAAMASKPVAIAAAGLVLAAGAWIAVRRAESPEGPPHAASEPARIGAPPEAAVVRGAASAPRPSSPAPAPPPPVPTPAPAAPAGVAGGESVSGLAFEPATGEPVPGAEMDGQVLSAGGGTPAEVRFRSGADGTFHVEGLPHGGTLLVSPRPGGGWFPPPLDPASPAPSARARIPSSGVRVPLCRPGSLEGTVRDPEGRPVGAAEVVLLGILGRFSTVTVDAELGRTSTDAEGRFRFDRLGPGTVSVLARETRPPPGTEELRVSDRLQARVVAGSTTRADPVVGPGITVSGTVLDAEGRPARARVYTFNRHIGPRQVGFVETDPEGRFTISGIPLRTTPGFEGFGGDDLVLAAQGEGGYGRSAPIPVRPGVRVRDAVVRLLPKEATTGRIEGRVCAPDGSAIPGAGLVLDRNNGHRSVEEDADESGFARFRGETVPVDEGGAFRTDGIDTNWHRVVSLVGTAPGWLPRRVEAVVEGGRTTGGIRVELRPGHEVRGRLLASDGSPVAGIPVQAFPAPEGSFGSSAAPPQAVTGADGTFVVRGLPDRHLCLNFGADPFRPLHRVNGLWPDGEEVVVRLPSRGTIAGRARSSDGGPAAGVAVRWHPGSGMAAGAERPARTGADGAFRLEDVPDGPFALSFGGPLEEDPGAFLAKRTAEFPAGTREVEVVLERGRFLEGIVEDERGNPAADATVRVRSEDPGAWTSVPPRSTDASGRFRAGPLPAGDWILRADRGDATAELAGVASGSAGLRLRLSSGGAIRGRVMDAAGEPVPGARVHLTHRSARGTTGTGGTTDSEGRFSLPALGDRAYVLEAEAGAKGSARLDPVAGGTADVVLRVGLPQVGALRGRVLDTGGRPAGGVVVHARRLRPGVRTAEHVRVPSADEKESPPLLRQEDMRDAAADGEGVFDFGEMPPGRWVAWAGNPGTSLRPANCVLFEGSGEPMDLRVSPGWTLLGRLVDDTGTGRVFVNLRIRLSAGLPDPAPEFWVQARTGRGGSFRVPGLPPGPVTVQECSVQPPPTWNVEERGEAERPIALTAPR